MQFLTIPQTGATYKIPVALLRTMQKQGRLPGFFSGSRFYVNIDLLMEQLDQESRSAVNGNTTTAK